MVFLDEVNELNGPLPFIPGSQCKGVIGIHSASVAPARYESSPDWISNLTAALNYSLDRERIAELVRELGLVAPKGPPG